MPVQYVVRAGDTLSRLATHVGVTLAEILELNPQIQNPNLVSVGQPILLPSAPKNLHKAIALENGPPNAPSWMKLALREVGVKEIPGDQHAQRILEYLAACNKLDRASAEKDETAWCSAFVCWVMERDGRPSTDSAWALSWKDWGVEEPAANPRYGAVAVFRRRGKTVDGGHVGFFIRDLGDRVEILGGNQSNSVRVTAYPEAGELGGLRYDLLGYRWPE